MPERLLTDSAPQPRSRGAKKPRATAPPLVTEERLLSGWGRTAPSRADVVAPEDEATVAGALSGPRSRGVIARGLGRSYGDAAQCAGGLVVDTRHLDSIGPIDPETGEVEVVPGSASTGSCGSGWARAGSSPSPGHPAGVDRRGDRGRRAREEPPCRRQLLQPRGVDHPQSHRRAWSRRGPNSTRDLFWATAGGMGLTGVVTRARSRCAGSRRRGCASTPSATATSTRSCRRSSSSTPSTASRWRGSTVRPAAVDSAAASSTPATTRRRPSSPAAAPPARWTRPPSGRSGCRCPCHRARSTRSPSPPSTRPGT